MTKNLVQGDASVLIEFTPNEDGWWTAELLVEDREAPLFFSHSGAVSQGRTLRSASRNVISAYHDLLGRS